MQRLDWHAAILGLVLDEDDAAARLEGRQHAGHHLVGVSQLVIDVDHDCQVYRSGGELDVVDRAQPRLDLRQAALLGAGLKQADHFRLHIDSPNLAARHHRRSHAPRQVSGSGANVGHHHAGAQREGGQQQVGALFALTFPPLKPSCALPSHHGSDLAPHIALADTVCARRRRTVTLSKRGGLRQRGAIRQQAGKKERPPKRYSVHRGASQISLGCTHRGATGPLSSHEADSSNHRGPVMSRIPPTGRSAKKARPRATSGLLPVPCTHPTATVASSRRHVQPHSPSYVNFALAESVNLRNSRPVRFCPTPPVGGRQHKVVPNGTSAHAPPQVRETG